MNLLLLLSLFLHCGPRAHAADVPRKCATLLVDVEPSFDPDLRLTAHGQIARYRNRNVELTAQEYHFLQLILLSPTEVLTHGEIARELWSDGPPKTAANCVRFTISSIREKLTAIDPKFNRIKIVRKNGYYWARAEHARVSVGRVAAAKYIQEGYVDGNLVPVSPTEWRLLRTLIEKKTATAESIGVPSDNCFAVVACRLNAKFKSILGRPLLKSGPRGRGQRILNPDLESH